MAENFLTRMGSVIGSAISKASPTATLGSSQIDTYELAGLWQLPEREMRLVGLQRYLEYDRMVRDISIVAAGVRLFLNLISNAVWTVNVPENLNGNEEPVAQGYADFLYNEIFGMTTSWANVVRKTASFRLHGFSVQEWTAKRNPDGTIGLLDIETRPQRTIARWVRDQGGTVEAVVQQVVGKPPVTIPRTKIVYAVDDTLADTPEGIGMYRHLYETADRLRNYLDLEEIGYQTDLRGIPIARAPLGEMQAEVIAAGPDGSDERAQADSRRRTKLGRLSDFVKDHIRNVHQGMMLPSDPYLAKDVDGKTVPSSTPKWGIDLLQGNSQSFADMAKAIDRCNAEMARIMGVEHLLLGGSGDRGSFALAQSKVGLFYQTITTTLSDLVEVFDRDIIAPIATLNGWPEELWPEFGVNEISDRDLDMVAGIILKLAQSGATIMPDDPIIGEMRDAVGFSRPSEDSVQMAMDASLNPNRNKTPPGPADQTGDKTMNNNPEDGITKRKMIRARPRKRRR